MFFPTLLISLLSLVALSAASPPSQLLVRVPAISAASIGQVLGRRQVSIGAPSQVPSQCTSACTPVNNEVGLGCPVDACCTTTFETEYYTCLVCVGTALNANFSTAQNSLNMLYTTCVDMGFVLPRLELPGQSDSSNATSGTATALFPTGSGSSGSATSATGAAVGPVWHGVRVEALIIGAVLLGIAGLW